MIPFTITPNAITCVVDGKHYQLDKTHINFLKVRNLLLEELPDEYKAIAQLRDLVDVRAFIAKVSTGRVQVSGNEVQFDGKPVHGHIAERLLIMLRQGKNPRPLMRFLERLSTAPIKEVADQFLRWLERSNMPLTTDGCFVAYKYVDSDLKDNYTHRIDNSPGALIPRIEANRINTNRNVDCAASGYHFCSFGYLANHKPVMLLKIAPEDVCSFPTSEVAKGRCLFYEIINRIPDDEIPKREIEGGALLYTGLHAPDPSVYQGVQVGDRVGAHGTVVAIGTGGDDDGQTHEADEDEVEEDHPEIAANEPAQSPRARQADSVTPKEKWRARLAGRMYQGKSLTQNRIMKLVAKHGINEVARRTGIPRTTLQGWLK